MRQYMETEAGKKVFRRTYEEALSVALAIGTRLERLAVDPIPPGWPSNFAAEEHYESWVEAVIAFYGDVKPSMLQDLERGRKTEIDFHQRLCGDVRPRLRSAGTYECHNYRPCTPDRTWSSPADTRTDERASCSNL